MISLVRLESLKMMTTTLMTMSLVRVSCYVNRTHTPALFNYVAQIAEASEQLERTLRLSGVKMQPMPAKPSDPAVPTQLLPYTLTGDGDLFGLTTTACGGERDSGFSQPAASVDSFNHASDGGSRFARFFTSDDNSNQLRVRRC